MEKYPIYDIKKWKVIENKKNVKGIHEKFWVKNLNDEEILVKHLPVTDDKVFGFSRIIAEKLSYELAKLLEIECARVDFIKHKANYCVGSYNFIKTNEIYYSILFLFMKNIFENEENTKNKPPITFEYIKKTLDIYNEEIYKEIIKIIIFDALVGESDRHPDNWGIIIILDDINSKIKVAPLFDTGNCLLYDWGKKGIYGGENDFNSYSINRNSKIIDDSKSENDWYNHFKLVKYLYSLYPEVVQTYINNLKILNDELIAETVSKIPSEFMNEEYANYLIKFISERRDHLLNIIEKN